MDEIHVPDLADGRLERGLAGQHAVATLPADEPTQSQALLIVVVQLVDADLAHCADFAHERRLPVGEQAVQAAGIGRGGELVAKRCVR